MKPLNKNKKYSLKNLTENQFLQLFNFLKSNDKSWDLFNFYNCLDRKDFSFLVYNGESWRLVEMETESFCATELFKINTDVFYFYLPHNPSVYYKSKNNLKNEIFKLEKYNISDVIKGVNKLCYYSLILRPLSDLSKEIEHNGEKFIPKKELIKEFKDIIFDKRAFDLDLGVNIINYPFWVVNKLLEWHFDLFNLIKSDKAIDINNLSK